MRVLGLIFVALISTTASLGDIALKRSHQKTCWFEEKAFSKFQQFAGAPHGYDVPASVRVDALSFVTSDHVTLRGYRIAAYPATVKPKGSVLFLQGDAMLADQCVEWLSHLGHIGYDIYVYDFRGYGNSKGESLFSDIVADYKEIINDFDANVSGKRMLYGVSFGGIVLLKAIAAGSSDALVIDSVPSKLPFVFNCDSDSYPINNVPANSSRMLLISGGHDRQVPPKDMKQLIDIAIKRSAQYFFQPDLKHPLLEPDDDYKARFPKIKTFWEELK
jgi:pimeloyl-ACP methyl ester carboxylesterase